MKKNIRRLLRIVLGLALFYGVNTTPAQCQLSEITRVSCIQQHTSILTGSLYSGQLIQQYPQPYLYDSLLDKTVFAQTNDEVPFSSLHHTAPCHRRLSDNFTANIQHLPPLTSIAVDSPNFSVDLLTMTNPPRTNLELYRQTSWEDKTSDNNISEPQNLFINKETPWRRFKTNSKHFTRNILYDYKRFYSWRCLGACALGIAVAAPFANGKMRDGYRQLCQQLNDNPAILTRQGINYRLYFKGG